MERKKLIKDRTPEEIKEKICYDKQLTSHFFIISWNDNTEIYSRLIVY